MKGLLTAALLWLVACAPAPAPEERPLLPLSVDGESLYLPLVAIGEALPGPYPGPDATATVDAPPIPTITPTSEATHEPAPTQAGTPTPTPGPIVSATPLPLALWPECPSHDITQWHSLIDLERQCHYSHEHGDDPFTVNGIFGDLGWQWGGGRFYPHLTDRENEAGFKHEFHEVAVFEGYPCINDETRISDGTLGVSALRLLIHFDKNADSTRRSHSFYVEIQGCSETDAGVSGTASGGGAYDTGILNIVFCQPRASPSCRAHAPLAGDPTDGPFNLLTYPRQRTHHGPEIFGNPAPPTLANACSTVISDAEMSSNPVP